MRFLLLSVRANLEAVAPPRLIVASDRIVVFEPLSITMLPVVEEPRVRVCALVVDNTPSPERYVAVLPLLPEIEAVGVPLATFKNANLAEVEAVPPIAKS
jgi:hypothetical protein